MTKTYRDLGPVAEHVVEREGTGPKAIRQRHALDVLHHQVGRAALFDDVVERADVGMIQGRNGPCLAFEPPAEVPGSGLDGDRAVQARVPALIHRAHATGADAPDNLIRPQAEAYG